MSEVSLQSESQMKRIEPFFPLAHGVPRMDDRRVLSGIVYVIRNGTPQGAQDGNVPAQKGPFPRHIGRTKGGLNSKLHAVCYDQGRPVRLHLTTGQVSDFTGVELLLADLSDEIEEVIGDRGYDSNKIRQSLADRNITACISPRKNRKSKPPYNWHLY